VNDRRRIGLAAAALAAAVTALAAALGSSPAPAQDAGGVTIYRDGYGVPHIEAGSAEGVAYGTGYALANDRPFLTEGIRLTAQGRTAELLGRDALEADVTVRRDFYDAADVQRQYDALPEQRKRELQAFSDGFNRGMDEVMADPNRRPAAFDALGYTPSPWQPTDSVSVLGLFTWISFAGEGGRGQLRNAELLARLERRWGEREGFAIWNDLLLKNDPAAPTPARRNEARRAPRSIRAERPGRAQRQLARDLEGALGRAAGRRLAESRRVAQILERLPVPRIGSYGVALSGRRTASGGAIVIGAPQTGINAPSIFWQLGQHAPGRQCTGMTVPGLPWTGIGWCNGHAWTLVAGNMGEQVDNYVERIHPEDPRRYIHDGEWRQMDVRRETFRVNRCVPPVCEEPSPPSTEVVEIESTVHGPVVDRDDERRIAITQRRAQRGQWARGANTVAAWNEARDMREFERLTAQVPATYNLLYGDRDGRTLYRFTGLQPVRAAGVDRRLPTPGTGGAEWRGMLPQRQMPRVASPRSGVLVANQGVETKPAPWWPNSSSVAVGQVTRVGWNRRLLGRSDLDLDRVQAIDPELLERTDGITPWFARQLRAALRRTRDERMREALALFDEWAEAGFARVDRDGDGRYDHPAVVIFGADHFNLPGRDYPRTLWAELLQRVFADELGAPVGEEDRGTFQVPGGGFARLSLLKLALDGRRASRRLSRDFVDDVRTPTRERSGTLVRESLRAALTELEERYGTADMRRWLPPVPTLRFGALGLVEPPPVKGFDHGTYVQIVDPRAGAGRYVLPPGNGNADSAPAVLAAQNGQYPRHFVDQREAYESYEPLPMPHEPEQYRAEPESVTRLEYPQG
jgi:penicillin G amidase